MKTKLGSELRVGEIIDAWFGPATISSLKKYTGPLHLWDKYKKPARIASFRENSIGMTIEPQMHYTVLTRKEAKAIAISSGKIY